MNHAQYGRQFSVSRYQSAAPGTLAALKKYLGSGLMKGVGPVLAEHIVNTFGLETLHVLDNHPERLAEVPGMGGKKAQAIADTWAERRALKELMGFLQNQGLPVALAVRILRKYGSAAEAVVRSQPYRLAAEVYGISFEVADAIAARAGVEPESLSVSEQDWPPSFAKPRLPVMSICLSHSFCRSRLSCCRCHRASWSRLCPHCKMQAM